MARIRRDARAISDDARPALTRVYNGLRTPAVDRLQKVASALDENLRGRVIFIGASILPLLQPDQQVFSSTRPTMDVDGVVFTHSYTEKARIEETLRALRFRHAIEQRAHADKWYAPDGTTFDLVSCGEHTGGTGNEYDRYAIESSVSLTLPPTIRHANAIGFLALKCGAFRDRGSAAPVHSKDLADIIVLSATRAELPKELREAPVAIRSFVRDEVQRMLESPYILSAISSHVKDREPLADDVEATVVATLHALAAT